MMGSFARVLGAMLVAGCMVGEPGSAPVSEEPDSASETAEEAPAQTTPIALTVSDGLDTEERIFLQKLNDYRAANGLAPLQVSVALTQASDFHSRDMATKSYFSHDSQDGTTWSARIRRYYDHNTYLAENIAAGNAGGDATFTQWKNSPGHDANMKGASYRVIGIARAYDAAATYRWYWTTDFGGYVDEVMTPDATTPPDPMQPPPPPPMTTNVLVNGDFAANDIGAGVVYTNVRQTGRWYAWAGSGSATIQSGVLRLYDALTGYISVAQLVAAAPGKIYDLKANAAWVSGSTGQVIYLDFLDSSYQRIGRSTISAGSSSTLHQLTRSVTAPAGTAFARVTLYGYAGNNDYSSTYTWDDLSLAPR
ncbi:MAG TPA: CAP domain-containing protein [Kofleriaceae bacterium]|nr:CAP domain-containing protein [Kofleriaceae bacterium]